MVKVISNSNAARSCRLHWDWAGRGAGFKSDGAVPATNSSELCLNLISLRSKCEEEHFCDALHSSLQSTRGGLLL